MSVIMLAVSWLFLLGPAGAAPGTITLSQESFTVQEKADFSWVYTVGEDGLESGSRLLIYDPVFQGMRWSKWGDLTPWWNRCSPQANEQRASWGLVSVHARRDDVRLDDVSVGVFRSNCDDEDMECVSDIHQTAWTEVEVLEGSLQAGDEVVVGIGDVGACEAACQEGQCGVCVDCGFEMPDRAFPDVAWPAELCPSDGDCESLEPPHIEITSLSTPDQLSVVVPSQAMAHTAFRLKVALLDRWGNPVTQARHPIEVRAPGGTLTHTLTEEDGGWVDFEVVLREPGVHRIEVTAGTLGAWSNPVEVMSEPPQDSIYWGDIHVHHGYTYVDEDGQAHDLNHDYGRDVAGLDIVSQSQKAAGIEIGEDRLWARLQESCTAYTEPDAYLVLLGFEWMGELASEAYGQPSEGHHNVYYDGCTGPLGTHDLQVIDSVDGRLGLWSWLEEVESDYGVRSITIPHAMRWTGRNFSVRKAGVQTLTEVYSEWGDNTEWVQGQQDEDVPGTTQDLMNSGLRLGWIGGSDNHDGWMGNPSSQKNERSGLGAFISKSLNRQSVFSAMKHRRTYATTGHRPIMRFRVEDGGAALGQGTELISQEPVLRWRYHGTSEIERLRLYRIRIKDDALQEVVVEEAGDGMDMSGVLQPGPLSGGSVAYWVEVRQWDGEVAWSSPIWLTSECSRMAQGAQDPLGLCDERSDEATASEGGVRCGCAQAPTTDAVWWMALMLMLIRRSERCSQRQAQG